MKQGRSFFLAMFQLLEVAKFKRMKPKEVMMKKKEMMMGKIKGKKVVFKKKGKKGYDFAKARKRLGVVNG